MEHTSEQKIKANLLNCLSISSKLKSENQKEPPTPIKKKTKRKAKSRKYTNE